MKSEKVNISNESLDSLISRKIKDHFIEKQSLLADFVPLKPSQFTTGIAIDPINDVIPRSNYISPGVYGDSQTSGTQLANSAVQVGVLTGFTPVSSPILATDTILQAFGKAQGQITSLALPLNSKGDILGFSTLPIRLGVGANNTLLQADSGQAAGIKWGNAINQDLLTSSNVTFGNITAAGIVTAENGVVINQSGGSLRFLDVGSMNDDSGISFFNDDVDYRVGFDAQGGTVGWIRQNVDIADSIHGFVWSAGMITAPINAFMYLRGDGTLTLSPSANTVASQSKFNLYGDQFLGAISLPSTPTSGTKLYSRTVSGTSNLYGLNSAGVETQLTGVSISPLTTKGDLYGFSTVNARIPIGTDGQVLTADSTQTLGLRWATPTADLWTASGNILRPTATGTINEIQLIALTASTGSLKFLSASNAGNTDTIITNASYGQASTLTIPDVGGSTGRFILSNSTGSQTISSDGSISLTANGGSVSLTSIGQIEFNAPQIGLNGTTTAFGQIYIDDAPLYISSSGNPLFKLQWDDTNNGMVADSMNGVGGSAPLWINPTAGKVGFSFVSTVTLQSVINVNGDIFGAYISTPSTPTASTGGKTYWKADKNYYALNEDGLEINLTSGDIGGGGWFKFSPSVGLNSLRATEWNNVNQVSGIRIDNNTSSTTFDVQAHAASGQLRVTDQDGIVRNLTGTTTATTANTNYSNNGSEDLIICNNFTSPITITIDATLLLKPLIIKQAQGASKLVTIQAAGGQTIDGFSQTIVFATGSNAYGNVTLVAQQGGTDINIVSGCTGTTGANNYNVDFAKKFEAEVWGNLLLTSSLPGTTSTQMTIPLPYTYSSVVFQAIPSVVQNSPNAPVTIKVISAGTSSVIVEVYNPGALAITSSTLTAQVRCIGI